MDSSLRKPYDIFPAIERLRDNASALSAEERARLKATIALNAADPRAVALLVDLGGDDWAHIYPPQQPEEPISTGRAIDTFLDRYGHSSPEEDALLEKLIFNPVPEYSGVLARQQSADGSDTPLPDNVDPDSDDPQNLASLAAAINNPADDSKNGNETADDSTGDSLPADRTPQPVQNTAKRPAQPPLSLELAKIFVKQGQFDRAYEIISKIVLNNPEKSVYFADQLRFLEKLIRIKHATASNNDSSKRP